MFNLKSLVFVGIYLICLSSVALATDTIVVGSGDATSSHGSVVVKDGDVFVDGKKVKESTGGNVGDIVVKDGDVDVGSKGANLLKEKKLSDMSKAERKARNEALKESIKQKVKNKVDSTKKKGNDSPPVIVNKGGETHVGEVRIEGKDSKTGTITINGKQVDPESVKVPKE